MSSLLAAVSKIYLMNVRSANAKNVGKYRLAVVNDAGIEPPSLQDQRGRLTRDGDGLMRMAFVELAASCARQRATLHSRAPLLWRTLARVACGPELHPRTRSAQTMSR